MINIILILFSTIFNANVENPEELGKVKWIRNYEQALTLSKSHDKPVFILFQEVPGCSTCKNYGNDVLSHPFIVEAIEDNFIPLVIYNNKGGKDGEVLKKYKEPTWNNPVVRVVDHQGDNIVDRLAGNYNIEGITNTIISSMLASNKLVPDYLHLLAEELTLNQGQLKESYVSMYCFWTGEKVIGDIKGVAETEAGFMDGKEVVKFKYNPNLVKYEDIIKTASGSKCADIAYTDDEMEQKKAENLIKKQARAIKRYKSDKTPKYYLSNTVYQYIPMTKLQALRLNSAIGNNRSPFDYLSPRQLQLVEHIEKNKNKKWEVSYLHDFPNSWWKVMQSLSIS